MPEQGWVERRNKGVVLDLTWGSGLRGGDRPFILNKKFPPPGEISLNCKPDCIQTIEGGLIFCCERLVVFEFPKQFFSELPAFFVPGGVLPGFDQINDLLFGGFVEPGLGVTGNAKFTVGFFYYAQFFAERNPKCKTRGEQNFLSLKLAPDVAAWNATPNGLRYCEDHVYCRVGMSFIFFHALIVRNGKKVSNDNWRVRERLPFDSEGIVGLNEFMRVSTRFREMVLNGDTLVLHIFSHSVPEVRRVGTSRSKIVLKCDQS